MPASLSNSNETEANSADSSPALLASFGQSEIKWHLVWLRQAVLLGITLINSATLLCFLQLGMFFCVFFVGKLKKFCQISRNKKFICFSSVPLLLSFLCFDFHLLWYLMMCLFILSNSPLLFLLNTIVRILLLFP